MKVPFYNIMLDERVSCRLPTDAVHAIDWLTAKERAQPIWVRCRPIERFVAVGPNFKCMTLAANISYLMYRSRAVVVSSMGGGTYNSTIVQLTIMYNSGALVIVIDDSPAPEGWLEIPT